MITRLPRKGGHPQTRRGLSLLPRIFSGDISISHSGVSRGHRNVPHASVSHYTTSPDSSGLSIPPNQTPLCSNGSFPSKPTSLPDRLNRTASAHPRTISLNGGTIHNSVTELASDLHTPNSVNDASLSNNQNTSRLLQECTPNSLTPPVTTGGRHP